MYCSVTHKDCSLAACALQGVQFSPVCDLLRQVFCVFECLRAMVAVALEKRCRLSREVVSFCSDVVVAMFLWGAVAVSGASHVVRDSAVPCLAVNKLGALPDLLIHQRTKAVLLHLPTTSMSAYKSCAQGSVTSPLRWPPKPPSPSDPPSFLSTPTALPAAALATGSACALATGSARAGGGALLLRTPFSTNPPLPHLALRAAVRASSSSASRLFNLVRFAGREL